MKRLDRCIKIICDISGISQDAFLSKIRNGDIPRSRHIACWYFYNREIFTLKTIGYYFGGMTHASVLNGIKKINNAFDTNDKEVLITVHECKRQLDEYLPFPLTAIWFKTDVIFCNTESIEITTTNILEL